MAYVDLGGSGERSEVLVLVQTTSNVEQIVTLVLVCRFADSDS